MLLVNEEQASTVNELDFNFLSASCFLNYLFIKVNKHRARSSCFSLVYLYYSIRN